MMYTFIGVKPINVDDVYFVNNIRIGSKLFDEGVNGTLNLDNMWICGMASVKIRLDFSHVSICCAIV